MKTGSDGKDRAARTADAEPGIPRLQPEETADIEIQEKYAVIHGKERRTVPHHRQSAVEGTERDVKKQNRGK